jgi:VanZ family protein
VSDTFPHESSHRAKAHRIAWLWLPVIAYAAVIFILSSISETPSLPEGISDKGLHGGLYAGFALVLVRALARGRWAGVTFLSACLAVSLAVMYGVSDEVHQSFVPGRTADAADVAADAWGAGAAASVAWIIARLGSRGTGARI